MWSCASADEEPLSCYQCRVERNEDCTDAFLKPCPTNQAYDVCMVSVTNHAGHVWIEKKCALGPCDLRDPKQSDGLGLDKCDRSQNTYSCFECCKGNGCNKSSAYGLRASSSSLMLIFSLSVTLLVSLFTFGQSGGMAGAAATAVKS
ncbi:uncharacterized protein LOC100901863 [Galendromus occidentalis]|uniref:Uncharacterized protein LOC100901863 n=1 Tax=Galendromus occidentalis TaxID=34638 RepID=A0AAJ6QPM6_9ACAR|nr:uncharacterized protein LOC100901863 [Galendromus occidentalis]